MIRLHSLNMNRFRGIREGSIEGLADVNLLVGRNNSGKTTVLEAIQRLGFGITGGGADLLGRKITHLWSLFRNEGDNEYPPDLWYRQDQLREIAIRAELLDDATGKKEISSWGVKKEGANPKAFQAFDASLHTAYTVLSRMTLFRPQDIHNRDIETKLWLQVLANRRDKFLTAALNEIFGLEAEGFQMPVGQLIVLFPDYSTPLDLQGDGTRTALRAMILLALLQKTLFLMEEPECHQHPGSLQRFAKAICNRAKEQELQILITTHSSECVRWFLEAAKTAGSQSAVFHLTLDNGVLQARHLDPETVETLTDTGVDVRFLDLYA